MKIALSGSHGTGKTTAAFKLSTKLKIENPGKQIGILQEVARLCPLPINERSTIESQIWMFTKQIEEEIFLSCKYDILICDRTALDTVAYAKFFNFSVWESMYSICRCFIKSYDEIYFYDCLNHPFNYEDGKRSTSEGFRLGVEEILLNLYKELVTENIIGYDLVTYENGKYLN